MNETTSSMSNKKRIQVLGTGAMLIFFGVMMLLAPRLNFENYFMLVIGGVMLAWGIFSGAVGWIIPGGIVSGIGVGVLAMESSLSLGLADEAKGGIFLVCFAAGWLVITLASRLFTRDTQTWALIPGGIMAVIGGLLLAGERGLNVLKLVGDFWPVALIVIGLALIFGWMRKH